MQNDSLTKKPTPTKSLIERTLRLTMECYGNLYMTDIPDDLLKAWIEADMERAIRQAGATALRPDRLLEDSWTRHCLALQAFFGIYCPERRGWFRSSRRIALRAERLFVEMQYILRVLAFSKRIREPLRLFSLSHFAGYDEVLAYLKTTRSGAYCLPFLERYRPELPKKQGCAFRRKLRGVFGGR